MNRWMNKKTIAAVLILTVMATLAYVDLQRTSSSIPMATALLVPDELPLNSHYAQMWMEAAQEDGVKLLPIHSSQWTQHVTRYAQAWEGAILPDTFHRKMTPGLSVALHQFVSGGGKLMVVHDAGTLDERGRHPLGQAELAPLVGFDYAMYNTLREGMSQAGVIVGGSRFFEEIGLPPGRFVSRAASAQSGERLFDEDRNSPSMQVVGYGVEPQRFPSLVTRGEPNGEVMLRNEFGSVVASRHRVGSGHTLFVNIPLTYLKQRTDSIFLHGFLRYFARRELLQPQLSEAPRGRGAIVMNWHVDAKPALPALQRLMELGSFQREGPFSFHVTAGPDVDTPGDQAGLDIDNNPRMQDLIKQLHAQGHAVASHGGWIHNYFGLHANENNANEMTPLLERNHAAMTRLLGVAPREYSAPMGNQPLWASRWLQDHGVIATYLTGNIGMGPTRLWIGDQRTSNLWTFPVLTLGTVATAEDAFFQHVTQNTFDSWLQEVARYVQEERTVRLVYFHPPGAVLYATAVVRFIDRIAACRLSDQCNWLTMTQAAEFMSKREQTDWALNRTDQGWRLTAQHADNLNDLTWRIPNRRFAEPKVVQGDAVVERLANEWLVAARSGKLLQIDLKELR
jgi:Polysaccharide deacetylase